MDKEKWFNQLCPGYYFWTQFENWEWHLGLVPVHCSYRNMPGKPWHNGGEKLSAFRIKLKLIPCTRPNPINQFEAQKISLGGAVRITVLSNDGIAADELQFLKIKMNWEFSTWSLISMVSCQCYWRIMYNWVNNCAFLSVKSWAQYYHMSRNCRVLGECLICQFVNRLLVVHFVFHYSPLGHKSERKNTIVFVSGTLPLFQSNIRQHVLSKSGLPPTQTKEIPNFSLTVKHRLCRMIILSMNKKKEGWLS